MYMTIIVILLIITTLDNLTYKGLTIYVMSSNISIKNHIIEQKFSKFGPWANRIIT